MTILWTFQKDVYLRQYPMVMHITKYYVYNSLLYNYIYLCNKFSMFPESQQELHHITMSLQTYNYHD